MQCNDWCLELQPRALAARGHEHATAEAALALLG
jgi:hypothetical protein